MNSDISIVIPTLNCKKDLIILVSSLERQTLQPAEIIISDSSEDSHIKDFIDSYSGKLNLIYLKNDRRFPGEKRNEGAKMTKTNKLYKSISTGALVTALLWWRGAGRGEQDQTFMFENGSGGSWMLPFSSKEET